MSLRITAEDMLNGLRTALQHYIVTIALSDQVEKPQAQTIALGTLTDLLTEECHTPVFTLRDLETVQELLRRKQKWSLADQVERTHTLLQQLYEGDASYDQNERG